MSHFVYKKPLQNQKVRDKYIGDRRDLQRARDAGIIDEQLYHEAKRQIMPTGPAAARRSRADSPPPGATQGRANSAYSAGSDGSASSEAAAEVPPSPLLVQAPRVPKGSLFDRNNLSVRIYKPQAQTEEQRESQKKQRKAAQLRELERATRPGSADEPSLNMLDSSADFQRYLGSVSSGSSSARSSGTARRRNLDRYGLFSKRLPSPAPSPSLPPLPSLAPSRSLPPLPSAPSSPSPSSSSSSFSRRSPSLPLLSRTSSLAQQPWFSPRPTSSSSRKASIAGTSTSSEPTTFSFPPAPSFPPPPPPPQPPTLADRILFEGAASAHPPPPQPKHPTGPPRSLRHSLSSDRPSTSASRQSWKSTTSPPQANSKMDAPTPTDAEPMAYGLERSHVTPPSLMLMDVFVALLAEFNPTHTVFEFARDESFGTSSEPRVPQPGEPAGFGAHLHKLRTVLKKRIWFLMAAKWLHFDRVLYSPGHHLLMMGADDRQGGLAVGGGEMVSQPGDKMKILDLDGPAMGDWAWHAALEYPEASVYVTFASDSPSNSLLASGQPIEYDSPGNVFCVQIPSGHISLAPLQTGSMDVVSSRYLPAYMPKDGWLPLMLEVSRVLKHDGYLEMTVLVLNDMGPLLRNWILDNVLSDPDHPRTFDVTPSKSVLAALGQAGFVDVQKVWTWMPTSSMGDEFSTVTSSIGQFLYGELYAPRPKDGGAEARGAGSSDSSEGLLRKHAEVAVWDDPEVMSECRTCHTSFRWLKVWARKPSVVPCRPPTSNGGEGN